MTRISSDAPRILVLGDISQSVWRDYSKGFSKYSRLHGGWVLYVNSPYYRNPNLKEITSADIQRWTIHGIIDNLTNPTKTTEILSLGLPTIVCDGIQKEALGKYSIIHDNTSIAEMGAKHFLDKKFIDFAYCGFDYMYWSQERGEAFAGAITKAGYRIHLYKQPRMKGVYSWENELPYLVEWLKTLPKPIGLMACNDDRGQHVLEACRVAELHVPEEVAVLGVDNDDFICELTQPSLTSICLNIESIGYQSAEILDRLMHGEQLPPQKLWVEPTAIAVRQSTDILAINDDEVKQAARFIRLNAMKPITVPMWPNPYR
jgi:LacI family transcriptional regulator